MLKCIKGPVSENTLAVNTLMSPKTTEICRKVLLSYFLIILSQTELGKVIFSQVGDIRTAC